MEVEARKWTGGTINVVHNVKGEQSAKKGDWLVGPPEATLGEIEVVKDIDFQRDYEPIDADDKYAVTLTDNTVTLGPVPVVEEAHLGNADGELPVAEEPIAASEPVLEPATEPTQE